MNRTHRALSEVTRLTIISTSSFRKPSLVKMSRISLRSNSGTSSISRRSRSFSLSKERGWDWRARSAPMPMARPPATRDAIPASRTTRVCMSAPVAPATKPIVEIRPSFIPNMTSRMNRPFGVCQSSEWRVVSRCGDEGTALRSRHRHLGDLHRRTGDAPAKHEVVSDRLDAHPHVFQVARDRDLLDRIRELPIFDPKADRAAGIVAGHHVDPKPDQLRDIEPALNRVDDLIGRGRAGRHVEVGCPDRGRLADATRRVAGRSEPQLTGRVGIQQVALEDAPFHDDVLTRGEPLPIERLGAQAFGHAAVVADRDQVGGDALPQSSDEVGCALVYGVAVHRAAKIAQEAAGDLRLEDHRHATGGDLARAQPADGPPAGLLPDGLRRVQPVQLPANGVPVIALHQAVLHSDRRDGARETGALLFPEAAVAVREDRT